MRRATSINSLGVGKNYQIDHAGIVENCIASFKGWCINYGAEWAHLFDEKTGVMIATYSKKDGLKILQE